MKYIQKLSIALALLCAYAPSLSAGKLLDLIDDGDSKQVEIFLKNGGEKEINIPNNYGQTPLYAACDKGHFPIVTLLLKNGAIASINTPDNDGWTPLYQACCDGNLNLIKLLLENGANPNTPNNYGETSLYRACCSGNLDITILLLKNSATTSINTSNNSGWTPLYRACSNGHLKLAKLLLENGADATLTTKNSESPLSEICTWSIKKRKKLLMMLIPTAKNLPQNTKPFIELVITTLAKQIKQNSTIAPKVPQNDGLLKSQAVENPKQIITCIEEFIRLQLFTPHKNAIYIWPENFYSLNENEVDHSKCFKPSLSQFRCRYYCVINKISSRQYAFLRILQNMTHMAIVQPKAITYNSSSTSSKAKHYSKLCDIIIKCHKPSSTESSVRFEDVTEKYGN